MAAQLWLRALWPWLVAVVVAAMVLYPVSWLVLGSFWSARPGAEGFLTLRNFERILFDVNTWQVLWTSIVISGGKTIIACAVGLFLAWLVTRTEIPLRGVVEVIAPLPFFVPGLLVTMGWAILANPTNGALNVLLRTLMGGDKGPINIYTMGGIIFVLALPSAALVYLLIVGAMRNMDTSLEESARMSGAGPLRTFFTVTLPLLAPSLTGAAILTFIAGLESFETPAILGIPGNVFVFTNEIYYNLRWRTPANYGNAMALAMLLAVITLLVVFLQWRVLGRRGYTTVTGKGFRARPVKLGRWGWLAFTAFGLYFLLAVALPIGLVIVSSFFRVFGYFGPETLTFGNYASVFSSEEFGRATANTLFLALGGGFLTMLLSSVVAYVAVRTRFRLRRALELVTWLPWALPGIVLSLAMLWAYIRLPIPIYGTVWVLLLAYVTFGLPIGVRTMTGVLSQLSPDLEESARMAGAPWRRSFVDITLALVRPGFVAGWFVLGFLFMRTVSIPLMLYSNGSEVLSMLSLRAWELSRGSEASAIATVMLLLMVAFIVADQLLRRWERRRARQVSEQAGAAGAPVPAPVPL